jgi:regulator of RNase E activity RraA
MNKTPSPTTHVRLSDSEISSWRSIPTAVISDETNCTGVMSSAIRPLFSGRRFAGHAVTVRTSRQSNGAPGRVLDLLRPGDVVVIDGSAHPNTAVWGGNLIAALQRRGGTAVIVDGRVRDTSELRTSGLAVYARDVTPAGLVWGGEINVSIRCGEVDVRSDMLVVGDDDGLIVLPTAGSSEILSRCLARLELEEEARQQDAASQHPST